ncbi:MAG: NAD(P)/FAD-dependent oxidoreductase [Solirubrobacterales bacterium]|nr:NAD(P)/FAD-dependent oxidoreductase [Solirubrobacterales bacterium]
MPVRATKRGASRTRLDRDCDVLICGASFGGLAVAREVASTGARVLLLDRYEIGERQTSACGIPTLWLHALGLGETLLQSFDELLVHTPWTTTRWPLPWSFATFDYRALCELMWAHTGLGEEAFETAKVDGVTRAELHAGAADAGAADAGAAHAGAPHTVHTDRGDVRAPLVVDALGWRRVLSAEATVRPPRAPLSRGLEVHPPGGGDELELWIDARYIRSGYSWSFPAREEVRVGVGSFWPTDHVREPTVRLAGELGLGLGEPFDYQGNWIPHALRPATEDGVFFVGDSAGHCLPLTAEGIRTAIYFGLACGRELRAVLDGRHTRAQALERYRAFSDAHAWKYRSLLRSQRFIGQLTPTPAVTAIVRAMGSRRLAGWAFDHYLRIAPPWFALACQPVARRGGRTQVALAR